MAPGGEHVVEVLLLLAVQVAEHALEQHLREADDGVQRRASSCDMLARNSDLCWLATSSRRPFSSISRKRLALAIATFDWLARACMRRTMRSPNSPGVRRTTTIPRATSSSP